MRMSLSTHKSNEIKSLNFGVYKQANTITNNLIKILFCVSLFCWCTQWLLLLYSYFYLFFLGPYYIIKLKVCSIKTLVWQCRSSGIWFSKQFHSNSYQCQLTAMISCLCYMGIRAKCLIVWFDVGFHWHFPASLFPSQLPISISMNFVMVQRILKYLYYALIKNYFSTSYPTKKKCQYGLNSGVHSVQWTMKYVGGKSFNFFMLSLCIHFLIHFLWFWIH